jgi:hypothetical protein
MGDGTSRRDDYLDAIAAKLEDPDAYVRYLADKLAREEQPGAPERRPRRPRRSGVLPVEVPGEGASEGPRDEERDRTG